MPATEPHLDVQCLIPCGWDPKLQIQAGPPIAQARTLHSCLLPPSTPPTLSMGRFSMTWDVSGGYRGAGESNDTRALAFSTAVSKPGLCLRLLLPKETAWGMTKCCFLVGIFCNNNLKSGAYGHFIFTKPAGL